MRELDECLRVKREIDSIDEKLKTIRAAILSPKNQVITGMPRGGNNDNVIERYIVKAEKLEYKKKKLLEYQKEQWHTVVIRINEAQLPEYNTYLLHNRFVKGYSWKKCVVLMQKRYGNWNINKVFRAYRNINKII